MQEIDKLIDQMRFPGTAICRIPDTDGFGKFHSPIAMRSLHKIEEIASAFDEIEKFIKSGLYIVAMVSYEAGPAFAPALKCRNTSDFPLLFFAAYKNFEPFDASELEIETQVSSFIPEISKECYTNDIAQIKKLIADGDTYQVNYTFRMRGDKIAQPQKLFLMLIHAHPVPYAAFMNTGAEQIVSLSPELFMQKKGDIIESRPMKGTARRMPSWTEDKAASIKLSLDSKNRAENVMITDMVRNDIGRICLPGSVRAKLFKVETYPTLHQLTSLVSGRLKEKASIFNIFSALFPPASITGAPKIRTSEIIAKHEKSPRKIYTGSIGCINPRKDFVFNVAIRTIIAGRNHSELGVGSGIVADSNPSDEWDECILKSRFYAKKIEKFELFETMLWERGKGFIFLNERLERMRNSQDYFGRPFDEKLAIQTLREIKFPENANFAKVRLRISRNGALNAEFAILEKPGWQKEKIRVCVAKEQTDPENVFLYHKTTIRSLYDEKYRLALSHGFDEVLFLNSKGEMTEGAISNIFMRKGREWLTPPLSCGLLPGIWREKMILKLGAIQKTFGIRELLEADEVMIGNSVRGGAYAKIEIWGGKL